MLNLCLIWHILRSSCFVAEVTFSETWISSGTTFVKKDSLKKHINSALKKQAVGLGIKRNLGAASYTQEIIEKTSVGNGLKKMYTDDRNVLEYKFHSAYYLALKERPFTDFPELLTLQEKKWYQKYW